MKRIFPWIVLVLLFCAFGIRFSHCDPAKRIPIQHNGRVKCFEAFSRQTLRLITEKETWHGEDAVCTILAFLDQPDSLYAVPWIKIGPSELARHLGLPTDRHFLSYRELLPHLEKIQSLVRSSQEKRDRDIRPSFLEQKAEMLLTRLVEVKLLATGESIRVIPPSSGDRWLSPYASSGPLAEPFKKMLHLFGKGKFEEFRSEVHLWIEKVHESTGRSHQRPVVLETHYLDLKPFQLSWVLYLLAFSLLGFLKDRTIFRNLGIAALGFAFFFHTGGLILRVLILERPPVSNMYESMVFMNWVLMAAAGIASLVKKNAGVACVGSLLSAVVMVYGGLLPIDPSLDVLVPVLRSNYWLTIHVLTIVSSYGILGLAMGLGHWQLIRDLRGRLSPEEEKCSAQLIYRVIQVGTLLLGIGTTLGGVWANESWGRFWGWDPKETWALIAFLGYLVVIHLRFKQVLSHFLLAVSSILGFLLILMTWYGVNFVLGRGLHSYGHGSGGMAWVMGYLLFEAAFLTGVALVKLRRFPLIL